MLRRSTFNAPNALSLLRLCMSIPLVYAVIHNNTQLAIAALLVAAFTDWADGYIARRYHLQTQLGAWLDPLADKVILNTTFIALAVQALVPIWVATLLVARDLMIIIGAFIYFRQQQKMDGGANTFGKLSTLIQFSIIGWCLFFPELKINSLVFLGMISVTLGSGVAYVLLWGQPTWSWFVPCTQPETGSELPAAQLKPGQIEPNASRRPITEPVE